MREWLKWLEQCEYKFVRTDNGEDEVREYDFGYGIRVIKKESGKGSRGGMVEVNGFTTWHGSVKDLIKRIVEVIEQAEEQIVEEVLAEEVEESQETIEEQIKNVLKKMHMTLDNEEWTNLQQEYSRLKALQEEVMVLPDQEEVIAEAELEDYLQIFNENHEARVEVVVTEQEIHLTYEQDWLTDDNNEKAMQKMIEHLISHDMAHNCIIGRGRLYKWACLERLK